MKIQKEMTRKPTTGLRYLFIVIPFLKNRKPPITIKPIVMEFEVIDKRKLKISLPCPAVYKRAKRSPFYENWNTQKFFNRFAAVNRSLLTGSIYALAGENGAGKTTLFRILAGLSRQTSGQAEIANATCGRAAPQS